MIYMLDSNVLRHLVQDAAFATKIVTKVGKIGAENIVISSISSQELIVAALNTKLTRNTRYELASATRLFHALAFDERAADEAAQVETELKARGAMIGKADMLIAGHARGLGMTLVTNNTREFKRVKGLHLVDWLA